MKFSSTFQMLFSALTRPTQRVPIAVVPPGRLLDIGGGGEGVIAQAARTQVIAVDKYVSEIHEAKPKAPDALWTVANAAALPFADHCFDNATAFFSCMYMSGDGQAGVFCETQRVLRKGGEFWIWDASMAPTSQVFAIRLRVDLPGPRSIRTAYGVKAKEQSAATIGSLLRQAGFESEVVTDRKHWFLLKATRL